jgi:hypothetical protein
MLQPSMIQPTSTAADTATPIERAISNAIAGRYALPKLKLLGAAWHLKDRIGTAVRITLAFLLVPILPVLFLLSKALSQALQTLELSLPTPVIQLLLSLASLPLLAPWITALMLMGIDAARGTPTGFARVHECYGHVVPLTLAALAILLFSAIGTLLFVLPGLYVLVGCTLALPLVVDARLSPAQALKVSMQAIHHRWFDVAAVTAVLWLNIFFCASLMGLPLWLLLPWQMTVVGLLYCAIFRSADDMLRNTHQR